MQTTTFCFRKELLLKLYVKFGLPVLLLVLAILLAPCGGTSGGSNKSAGTEDKFTGKEEGFSAREIYRWHEGYGPRLGRRSIWHGDEEW